MAPASGRGAGLASTCSSIQNASNGFSRGYNRCGLDFESNRRRMFNTLHGEDMRPVSRFNTVARVSYPNAVGKAALKAARLDDEGMKKDFDEFDRQAKAVNARADRAAEQAAKDAASNFPRANCTRNMRYRERVKLGSYFPEHKDNLGLHPFKPQREFQTTNSASYPGHHWSPARPVVIAPIGFAALPRRATPPGAWVPGGHTPIPKQEMDFMKHAANGRAQMLLPLGNQRPGVSRPYV